MAYGPRANTGSKVTLRQLEIVRLLQEHDMQQSKVAAMLDVEPSTVRKHYVAYLRNLALDAGQDVPMMRDAINGRVMPPGKGGGKPHMLLATVDGVEVADPSYPKPLVEIVPDDFDDAEDDLDVEDSNEEDLQPRLIFNRNGRRSRRIVSLPASGIMRFVIAVAQEATEVHQGFWRNLEVFKRFLEPEGSFELVIPGCVYNKRDNGQRDKLNAEFLSARSMYTYSDRELSDTVYFDETVADYMSSETIEIDGRIDICAEINMLPTAVNPISGFQTYSGPRWAIIPHVKHQLECVATMPGKRAKSIVTTGAVTVPNYIQKKAGQKAEMHHVLGCVIVEVLPDGRFFVRTINADPVTGDFHDLDIKVSGGKVTRGNSVATISYGDIHHEKLDPDVAKATWGYDPETGKTLPAWRANSLLDRLRPQHQFFHDLSDFTPRNHHNTKDPHFLALQYFSGQDNVKYELERCSRFLTETSRPWCASVVVQSNHDNAFLRWLKEGDVRQDPLNAAFWHMSNARCYTHIEKHRSGAPIFEWVLREASNDNLSNVTFIDENSSYVVLDIEYSQHGHLGPNGSRGATTNLYKIAPKMVTGHTHTPAIRDGLFTSGCCNLEQGYNRGPSGWAIAHTIGHMDGSRQILFYDGGSFYAENDQVVARRAA